jgi:hypothetical protein
MVQYLSGVVEFAGRGGAFEPSVPYRYDLADVKQVVRDP